MRTQASKRAVKISLMTMAVTLFGGMTMAFAQKSTAVVGTLNEQEIQGLVHMVEEEKLAGDVYETLYAKTGIQNFGNIVQSERRHQAALQNLLKNYGITDPTAGKAVGEFNSPAFATLYQDLVKKGSQSNADALKVGLKIEDLDIYDLDKEVAHTERADIKQVYDNLNRGSRNHLRSFNRALAQTGQSYTREFISQAQYNSIANSAQEKGDGSGQGGGQGKGQGKGQGRGQGKGMGMGRGMSF